MHSGQDLWTLDYRTAMFLSLNTALSRPMLPVPPIILGPLVASQAEPAAVVGNFDAQACQWDWSTHVYLLQSQNPEYTTSLENSLVDLAMPAYIY